jgi:predicted TPR repeat methyltransferase
MEKSPLPMNSTGKAALHDAYASEYDAQVLAYDCWIADLLFGLSYEFIHPGQTLLDVGVGSGLSAQLFAKAGLEIHGMDFSAAMLDICREKGFASGLVQHNLENLPWPYPSRRFDHLVSCGVLHFISDLDGIFGEASRLLVSNGLFAFTTRLSPALQTPQQKFISQMVGDSEIFSHAPAYLEALLAKHGFALCKTQKCFVGNDLFLLWMASKP